MISGSEEGSSKNCVNFSECDNKCSSKMAKADGEEASLYLAKETSRLFLSCNTGHLGVRM